MRTPKTAGRAETLGFSLVELLVAIAVLTLMMAILVPVFTNTVQATNASRNQLEATRQGRAVLDTLRDDFANLVLENEAATVFAKTDGTNSHLVFVTRRNGPQGADQRYMAVSYTLDGNKMKRNYLSIPWDQADLMTQAFRVTSSGSGAEVTEAVLADGLLRFEVVMLLDNGNVVPLSGTGSWIDTTWKGTTVPGSFYALHMTGPKVDSANPKVRALTVAVASVDAKCLRLPNAGKAATVLVSASNGETPSQTWNTAIYNGKLASYPRPAVASLRILQRTFLLQ